MKAQQNCRQIEIRLYFSACVLLILALAGLSTPVRAVEGTPPIATVPQDGFNLAVDEQLSPTNAILRFTGPARNWFAGTFTHLPVGQPVTLGFSLTGNHDAGEPADVKKWVGLHPVMTYADPTQYASYEWFAKDPQGRWVSGDPFKTGEARYAGAGPLPVQSVIPPDTATQCLSSDGAAWCPWREVDDTAALSGANIFRITNTFTASTATIAMRIPYTYTYLQTVISRLQAAKLPGVTVDEVGTTPGGRKLQIIRLTDPGDPQANQHTVLVIAREHATEPAGSWVIQGMVNFLLSEAGRSRRAHSTWLFIPIEDPDGSADAVFDRLTDQFFQRHDSPRAEVLAYSQYFARYIARGGVLDISLSLHNLEANEAPNVVCPFMDMGSFPANLTVNFNRTFFALLKQAGLQTLAPDFCWANGWAGNRLYVRLAGNFGALDLAYEINDRYPANRLSLPELQDIGRILATQLVEWNASEAGVACHTYALTRLAHFRAERKQYFAVQKRSVESRTPYDIINYGY